jgi:alkanesulfonate monooxygenase SsuD/methylene tetrahydromethanopterin reductase-like flavin-dependent oxidoreductase (luciferase family)
MIIGAGLDARLGLAFDELRNVGREAAVLGFESLWTPAGGVPDAFHVCAGWSEAAHAANGDSLRTGIAVVPAPRMWNPASLAAQAATVGLISHGQFVLGIGTGGAGAPHFAALGMPNRPIAVMADYLTILRGLLAGEEVTYQGVALRIDHFRLGGAFPKVPVFLAALGPQMLFLAGAASDGASLNWATPTQIAWSRERMLEGAASVGRDPSELCVSMYIRVCIDEDVDAARRAFGAQVLGYALARPGSDPTVAYRGLFGRMGFDDALRDLEARRDAGAKVDELVSHTPEALLQAVGYYGPAAGAAERFATLSAGLDETIVRVVTARPGPEPVIQALEALTPTKIRAAMGA